LEQRPYCDQIHGLFTGNPQYDYKIEEFIDPPPLPDVKAENTPPPEDEQAEDDEENGGAGEEDEEGNDDEDGGGQGQDDDEKGVEGGDDENGDNDQSLSKKPKVPQKIRRIIAVKELTRLAAFVSDIEQLCRIVPRGHYLLEHDKLVKNQFFQGLSLQNAGKLTQYLHARPRMEKPKLNTTFTDCFDCLDPIIDDIPQGVWTIKHEPLLDLIVGANLLYPGFNYYHKAQTPTFGQYYFGTGERNLNLCFML